MRLIRRSISLLVIPFLMVFGSLDSRAEDKLFADVDRVDYDLGHLVLDDTLYSMALNLKVHDEKGVATIYAIKQGVSIYYTLNGGKVSEVWILPKKPERPF